MKLKFFFLSLIAIVSVIVIFSFNPEKDISHYIEKYAYPESKWLTFENEKIHYREVGEGEETIVLIHGMGGCMQHFDSIVPALSENYKLVLFDYYGHGLSNTQSENDYSDAELLKLQKTLYDHLGLENFSIIVSSFGNYLASLYLENNRDRVNKLIVLGGNGGICKTEEAGEHFSPEDFPFADELSKYFLPEFIIEKVLEKVFYSKGDSFKEALGLTVDMYSIEGHRTIRKNFSNHERNELKITDFGVPTYLIYGEFDAIHTPCQAKNIQSRFKNKPSLDVIPACGHLPMLEKPDETIALIDKYMQQDE